MSRFRTVNRVRSMLDAWKFRHHARKNLVQINKEGGFYLCSGHWYQQDIGYYASAVKHVPGAFAEIGVRHGVTFRKLIPIARSQLKSIYGIDSFEGTKQSSKYDSRPDHDMSIGGTDVFFDLMNDAGFDRSEYQALVGWIPEVFKDFPRDIGFSFVLLDEDNYTPTRDSLDFVWPRINRSGVLLLDDFCTYHQKDAGRAIREFLRDTSDYWLERVLPNYQLILRKQ